MAPIVIFIVWIGVYPNAFLRFLDAPAAELMERMSARTVAGRLAEPEIYGGDEPMDESEGGAMGDEGMAASGTGEPGESARVEVDAPPPPPAPPVGSPGSVTR